MIFSKPTVLLLLDRHFWKTNFEQSHSAWVLSWFYQEVFPMCRAGLLVAPQQPQEWLHVLYKNIITNGYNVISKSGRYFNLWIAWGIFFDTLVQLCSYYSILSIFQKIWICWKFILILDQIMAIIWLICITIILRSQGIIKYYSISKLRKPW